MQERLSITTEEYTPSAIERDWQNVESLRQFRSAGRREAENWKGVAALSPDQVLRSMRGCPLLSDCEPQSYVSPRYPRRRMWQRYIAERYCCRSSLTVEQPTAVLASHDCTSNANPTRRYTQSPTHPRILTRRLQTRLQRGCRSSAALLDVIM